MPMIPIQSLSTASPMATMAGPLAPGRFLEAQAGQATARPQNLLDAQSAFPLKPPHWLAPNENGFLGESQSPVAEAAAVREAFTEFIGKTVFGQMLKAMRKSVGKPAYFHGGQAEEIFRSQLDETLAAEITEASADQWANPLFEHQFPRQAALLKAQAEGTDAATASPARPALQNLVELRRW